MRDDESTNLTSASTPAWLDDVLDEIRTRQIPLICKAECYLRNDDDLTDQWVSQLLTDRRGDLKRFEYEMNRRFVVANILDELVPDQVWTSAALREVAVTLAEVLRQQLCVAFQGRQFEVEIIGADFGDDEVLEPLEVCVTFSRVVEPSAGP